MKKQSIVLTISILIHCFGISQTFIKTDSITCIPNAQLKQAVVLIEEGKLAKQEVSFLRDKVSIYEKRIAVKDTLINNLWDKDFNWRLYSQKSEQTIANMNQQMKNLEESFRVQKKVTGKLKVQRFLLCVFSAFTLTYAIINLP
jgi:hypothetical protein